MSEINYQEAYEREHEKCADLASFGSISSAPFLIRIGKRGPAVQTGPDQKE